MAKKKVLAVGILAVAIVMIVVVTLSLGGSNRTSACVNLIISMERGDADASYAMLSNSAQSLIPTEEWVEEIEVIQRLYAGRDAPPELIAQEEATSSIDGQLITSESYLVESDFGPWMATCTFYENDGGNDRVSSFDNDFYIERD